MNYDAAIRNLLIFLLCLAGRVLIGLGRPFAAAVLAASLALVFLVVKRRSVRDLDASRASSE